MSHPFAKLREQLMAALESLDKLEKLAAQPDMAPAVPVDKEAERRARRGYKPLGKYLADRREVREQLADVLETLPEPVTCADLVKAFVALVPGRAKWCESGVSNALFAWTQAGWLTRDGTRKPGAYRRTKAWRADGKAASDVTQRYHEFRSGIPGKTQRPEAD